MTTLRKAAQAALDALKNAHDDVLDWGAYAGDYFKDKHDLEGCVARIKDDIEALRAALAHPDVPMLTDEEVWSKWSFPSDLSWKEAVISLGHAVEAEVRRRMGVVE